MLVMLRDLKSGRASTLSMGIKIAFLVHELRYFMNGWTLPIGGAASGRVCACPTQRACSHMSVVIEAKDCTFYLLNCTVLYCHSVQ